MHALQAPQLFLRTAVIVAVAHLQPHAASPAQLYTIIETYIIQPNSY